MNFRKASHSTENGGETPNATEIPVEKFALGITRVVVFFSEKFQSPWGCSESHLVYEVKLKAVVYQALNMDLSRLRSENTHN